MPLSKWTNMLERIKHHPIRECKLMGMGEPMLHPQFDRITEEFKRYFPKSKVIVATNCQYNISKGSKMRSRLEQTMKNIDMLYFSIDGYKENYERDRSPAKWEKLIKFLEDFQLLNRSGCKVVINYVVNKQNIFDIPKINAFQLEYNLDDFRLNIAQDWSEDNSITNNSNTWGYSEHQLSYLKGYKDYIKGKSPWTWSDCFWPRKGLYVTVEGDVKICCLNTGAQSIGNIFREDIEHIRSSPQLTHIANSCKSNAPTSHCKNCSYKELSPLLEELEVNN
tara:strand:- start:14072 stop:14908 length:837 start_codon:yes stop_codon:yes gene_type:complete